ncbi:MAG: substrate-binding periplasmic protein [Gammaproteobacteria bacterium]
MQKRIFKITSKILKLLVGAGLFIAYAVQSETVSFRTDDYPPFNSNPNAPLPGYMVEISKKILIDAGYEFDYQKAPWERSLLMMREGKIDCVYGTSHEDLYKDLLFTEEPFTIDTQSIFVHKDNPWRYGGDPNSILGLRWGLILGYDYGNGFDEIFKSGKVKVDWLSGDNPIEKNLLKLVNKRIEATLDSAQVIGYYAKKNGYDKDIVNAGQIGEPYALYISCSPVNSEKSKKILNLLDTGLEKMRADGSLKSILDKYGLPDWKK